MRTINVTPETVYQQLLPMITSDSSLDDLRTLSKLFHEDFLRSHPEGKFVTRCKPSDEVRPTVRVRRKRQNKALVRFIELWDKDVIPAPPNEGPKARELRLLESIPIRFRLAQEAGILSGKDEHAGLWYMKGLKSQIADARIDARAERSDY